MGYLTILYLQLLRNCIFSGNVKKLNIGLDGNMTERETFKITKTYLNINVDV